MMPSCACPTASRSNGRHWWDVITSGARIVLAPRSLNTVVPEHFGGTNFTWPLLQSCARHDLRVYLIGSPQGREITETADFLQERIPGLRIAGTRPGRDDTTGRYSKQLEESIAVELAELQPDIILVGLPFQMQLSTMSQLTDRLEHGIFIGEGGTFDYDVFGGNKKKAPKILQQAGLEWLWRLLIEPARIKRQLAIPRFIWQVYRSAHRNRLKT